MGKKCRGHGCKAYVPARKIMCLKCWQRVPRPAKHVLGMAQRDPQSMATLQDGRKLNMAQCIRLCFDALKPPRPAPVAAAAGPTARPLADDWPEGV